MPLDCQELGLDEVMIVNDFGAVAHAVANLNEDSFEHLCGPDRPLPSEGMISLLGREQDSAWPSCSGATAAMR